jgi:hypothetical protein
VDFLPSVLRDRCDVCLLTPGGTVLLEDVARGLQAARGTDGSWVAVRCPACRRVTAVIDHEDDTCFGASLSAVARRPRAVTAPMASAPVAEDDPLAVRRRHVERGPQRWLPIALGGTLTLVMAGALLLSLLLSANAEDPPSSQDSLVIDARPTPVAGDGEAVTEGSPIVAALPSAGSEPVSGIAGPAPDGIEIGIVEVIHTDGGVAAVTRIRNDRSDPLPPSEVSFTLIDGSDRIIGESVTLVELAPGQTQTVGVERVAFLAGQIGGTTLRVSVHPQLQGASRVAPGRLSLSDVHLIGRGDAVSVGGRLTDGGGVDRLATISCALRGPDGELVAVVVGTLEIQAYETRPFRIRGPTDAVGLHVASCGVS